MAENLFTAANERYSIIEACNEAGVDIPDFSVGSVKTYCPFGLLHADGGYEKAFRVYPSSNTAHCFAGCGFFTPVRLLAKYRDISDEAAVDLILERTNYVPPDYVSQWEALVGAGPQVDRDGLSEALKVACARMDPTWEERQFEDHISAVFRNCLGLLPKVRTQEDATQWLSATKTVMQRALGATP